MNDYKCKYGFYISKVFILFLVSCKLCSGLAGSFYGDSFIHVPIEDATGETDVKVQFRTHRPNGLLLLAAGDTDFCAVELESGTVVVRIDLGSGEAVLRSPPGLVFNDLRWHKVHLRRVQAEVQLKIDDIYNSTTRTPGRFFELNINHGVYLGGVRTSNGLFFGLFRKYRGCLEEVVFNGIDILKVSKEHTDPMNRYGVTWDCSSEFSATSELPLTFLSNMSFIAFPGLTTRPEIVRFTFDLRTRSQNALFLYHSGRAYNSDFLVIEILNGHISMTVNKGNGAIEFVSKKNIADGMWHQIEVVIDPVNLRLGVDGVRKERRTNFGENQFLDLDGYLYIGGLDVKTRAKAMRYQLPSLGGANAGAGSVIGCMQNFKINGDLYGFREADITKDIHPECLWSFPCTNMPCVERAECIEEGYYHYRCICDRTNCFKTGSSGEVSILPVSNVIHVQDIVVREGDNTLITTSNIDLFIDYDGYGIAPSAVNYKVVNAPEYGYIDVMKPNMPTKQPQDAEITFTQEDLLNDRVYYVHDDSETYSDSIGIELMFKTDSVSDLDNLPAKFLQTYGITIMIQIAPWNDRPILYLPDDSTLTLVENTFVVITPKLIEAEDRDDRPRNLEYTVQYQQGHDVGYFEIADLLGTRARITQFTQEDINEERIKFVHRGAVIQNFRIQVSDGKDTSEPQILRVNAVPLKLTKEANTGLHLLSGGTVLLHKSNLSYASNALSQHIDIRYEITDPTYYGEIQRKLLNNDEWITTVHFTQEDIDDGRIRYRHFPMELPETDYFHYHVRAKNVVTQDFQFFIYITPVRVNLTRNVNLILKGKKEKVMTVDNLNAVSTVQSHTVNDIVYSILNPPAHGNILKESLDSNSKIKLTQGSNFTQNDINQNRIIYRFDRTSTTVQRDHFQFRLLIPGGDDSSVSMFDIVYQPSNAEERIVNNLLTGTEGGKKQITVDDLYIETQHYNDYMYTITSAPKHGTIQIIDRDSGRIEVINASSFTNADIINEKLYYSHDGSENAEDSFDFMAKSELNDESKYQGTFDIQIDLINDHEPYRVDEKVFNVVLNQGRIVTLNDLRFIDPDKDFDDSNLLYTWRKEIEDGYFVKANNHDMRLSNFTQRDLERGNVFFIHNGERFGRSVLWVSDGKHLVSTLLEVRASDPFINVANNTGLEVEKGNMVLILPKNLYIRTNLDVTDEDVKFLLEVPPVHGKIIRNGNPKQRFTMKDIRNKKVSYKHDNSNFLQDSFRFRARIDAVPVQQVQGVVHINITTEDDVQPPEIITNKILTVEERDRLTISKQYLKTEHTDYEADQIIYNVTKPPSHGILMFRTSSSVRVDTFTQEDINKRRLQYYNTEAGYLNDNFIFDVSNHISALAQVAFLIDIVPVMIPLEVKDFMVSEGQGHVLNTEILKVTNRHFVNEGLQYVITKEPISGWIENMDNPTVKLVQFSHEQILNEQIYYEHDGNDTTWDEFSVMVRSSSNNKQSNPHTIHITVKPSNDQTPKIMRNVPLKVWIGSTTPITVNNLKAVDPDSPPEHLMFVTSKPTNGDIVLESNPQKSIINFTQAHINRAEVMFVHAGEMSGQFHFQVSDGTNRGKRHTFEIQASPLELTVEKNLLKVYPGVLQPITREHLDAYTNDENQFRPIMYSLTSKPARGELLIRYQNDSLFEVASFSQEEIDQGLIFYQHITAMTDDSPQYDTFIFDVTTSYAARKTLEILDIIIAYENINDDNQNQLLEIIPVEVSEGGHVVITDRNLNAERLNHYLDDDSPLTESSVNFLVTELPKNGLLKIAGQNVSLETIITERDLEGGHVVYTHDHSETLWDLFRFKVEIEYTDANGVKRKKMPGLIAGFNITIKPVNDQKYEVLINYPYLELVQGFTANITSEQLLTVDKDTPPTDINYKIVAGPDNGFVIFRDEPNIPIKTFTQEDVNMGRIVFVQDKSTMESGAFYFSVDDGQFEEFFMTFIIRVHPLSLEVGKMQDVRITQGHVSAVLTPKNFNVKTNGDKNKVIFNVTRPPMYGQLYMNDKPVNQFSGKDIEHGNVQYVQTDLSVAKDFFEFNIYDIQNIIMKKKLNVKVLPHVTKTATEPFQVLPEETVDLTLDYLDASELARQTNSVPMYIITRNPKRGEVVKLLRFKEVNKRDTEQSHTTLIPLPVSNFSHQDVKDNKVQYRCKSGAHGKDGFNYLLTAENVQPAPGHFEVVIVPPEKATPARTKPPVKPTPKPADKEVVEKEMARPGRFNNSRITIVIVVVAISICAVFGFIIYWCVKKSRRRKREELIRLAMKAAQKEQDMVMVGATTNQYVDPYEIDARGSSDSGTNLDVGVYRSNPQSNVDTAAANPDHNQIPIIITSESDDGQNTHGSSSLTSRSMQFERPKYDKHQIGSQPQHSSLDMSLEDRYNYQQHESPSSVPQSPDLSRIDASDYSQDSLARGVPTCKVTPLCGSEDSVDKLHVSSRDSTLPSRSGEAMKFNWEQADPELLQHCRKSNPVLHKTKHWV